MRKRRKTKMGRMKKTKEKEVDGKDEDGKMKIKETVDRREGKQIKD